MRVSAVSPERSTASGTAACIRAAISKLAIRASSSEFSGYRSEVLAVQLLEELELMAAGRRA